MRKKNALGSGIGLYEAELQVYFFQISRRELLEGIFIGEHFFRYLEEIFPDIFFRYLGAHDCLENSEILRRKDFFGFYYGFNTFISSHVSFL